MSGYKRSAVPNSARRHACVNAGAVIGERTPVSCYYCGTSGEVDWTRQPYWPVIAGLEVEHRKALRAGGTNSPDNMTLACRNCNRRKRDADWS